MIILKIILITLYIVNVATIFEKETVQLINLSLKSNYLEIHNDNKLKSNINAKTFFINENL